MRRVPLIGIVAVLALGAGAGGAGAAPPADADTEPEISVGFHLEAGGFLVKVGNNADDDQDELTVSVSRKRQLVQYTAIGKVTERGIEAQLGKLGEISLAFEPTETRTGHLPSRCKGEPGRGMMGIYTGTFRLRGERGFLEVEKTQIEGTMHVSPYHYCPPPKGFRRPPTAARPAARQGEDLAVLSAGGRRQKLLSLFAAIASRRPGESSTAFISETFEEREKVQILHYAIAHGRNPAFRYDLGAGTAMVQPSWPFQGNASFRRGRNGHNSWSGSLRVRMLGIGTVDLVAPGSRAKITNEYNDE